MTLVRTILTAATVLSLSLIALGCDQNTEQANTDMDSLSYVEAELMLIDSTTTNALPAGDMILVDLTLNHMVYAIDLLDADLDIDRILVREDADGDMLLAELLETEIPEQGYDPSELERIVFTAESENYGTLSPADIVELNTVGSVVHEFEEFTTGTYGQMMSALKIEIYWESKKGKDRCIKISLFEKDDSDSSNTPSKVKAASTAVSKNSVSVAKPVKAAKQDNRLSPAPAKGDSDESKEEKEESKDDSDESDNDDAKPSKK
jgi:hypothetical protein